MGTRGFVDDELDPAEVEAVYVVDLVLIVLAGGGEPLARGYPGLEARIPEAAVARGPAGASWLAPADLYGPLEETLARGQGRRAPARYRHLGFFFLSRVEGFIESLFLEWKIKEARANLDRQLKKLEIYEIALFF